MFRSSCVQSTTVNFIARADGADENVVRMPAFRGCGAAHEKMFAAGLFAAENCGVTLLCAKCRKES
jgi:hypothetical protein